MPPRHRVIAPDIKPRSTSVATPRRASDRYANAAARNYVGLIITLPCRAALAMDRCTAKLLGTGVPLTILNPLARSTCAGAYAFKRRGVGPLRKFIAVRRACCTMRSESMSSAACPAADAYCTRLSSRAPNRWRLCQGWRCSSRGCAVTDTSLVEPLISCLTHAEDGRAADAADGWRQNKYQSN